MESSPEKRPRSEQDENEKEKTHLKKCKLDLNTEPEPEEEVLNEEANHSNIDKETEEQDEIVKAAFAISHVMFIRDLTRNKIVKTEEEETNLEQQETAQEERPLESVVWLSENEKQRWIQKKKHEADKEDEDDSDATLDLLSQWMIPATPPEKIVSSHMIEKCSKPIRKQMTKEDLEQSRLGLSKSQVAEMFLPLLEEREVQRGKDGVRFSVYGPDGKVREMMMWQKEKNEVDLTLGWRKFVEDYDLKEICDFVTVWMFRHKLSHEICVAVDTTRLGLRKKVSKRISKAAFGDSD